MTCNKRNHKINLVSMNLHILINNQKKATTSKKNLLHNANLATECFTALHKSVHFRKFEEQGIFCIHLSNSTTDVRTGDSNAEF